MGIVGDNKANKEEKGKKLGKNQEKRKNRKKWGRGQRGMRVKRQRNEGKRKGMDKNGKERGESKGMGKEQRNGGEMGRNGTSDVTSDLASPSQFQRQLLEYQEQRNNLRKKLQETRKPRGGSSRRGSRKWSW